MLCGVPALGGLSGQFSTFSSLKIAFDKKIAAQRLPFQALESQGLGHGGRPASPDHSLGPLAADE